jgi:hypothetical protein
MPRAGERVKPHRDFDPRRIGNLEADAWIAYYRRDWWTLLRASLGLTRQMFGLPWLLTLRGAWYILRGNQLWAANPDNDPDGARRVMAKFYALVARYHGETLDPVRAAELEVEWWRVHRAHQYGEDPDRTPLVDALTALYAYTYSVDPAAVRPAADQRALAMDISDAWIGDGCRLDDPALASERAALVRSYAALLSAVHQ